MSFYDQSLAVPEEISRKAIDLKIWMEMFGAKSVNGMGDVLDAHRQLGETKALLAEGVELVRDQGAELDRLGAEICHLQRQMADVARERDAWKGTHDGLQQVYRDIGANLGADMPRELVNEVARRRMAQLAAARALISEVEHSEDTLPKGARYAIEAYRQKYPEEEKP